MTHHVYFPPYLPRGKIDGEPHPVDAAERPVLGHRVPGIEYHVLAVVQRILRQTLGMAMLDGARRSAGRPAWPARERARSRKCECIFQAGGLPSRPAIPVVQSLDWR